MIGGVAYTDFDKNIDYFIDLEAAEEREKLFKLNFVGPIKPPCKHKWKLVTVFEMCGLDGDDVEVYECRKCKEQVMSDTPWWENSNG